MASDASFTLSTATSSALHTVAEPGLGAKATPQARARAKAVEFEQVFLSTMFNQMFAGLESSGPFHGGQAEETWRGILVDRYAGEVARAGGIGLADAVYAQLLQVQEGATK
ncbi:MAG: rod-binding protein [Siculibacillus sp.]|nr:rod-binding protein [Siculibacillus sp.]